MRDGERFSLTACSVGHPRVSEPIGVVNIEVTEQDNLRVWISGTNGINLRSEVGEELYMVLVVRRSIETTHENLGIRDGRFQPEGIEGGAFKIGHSATHYIRSNEGTSATFETERFVQFIVWILEMRRVGRALDLSFA